MTHGVLGGSDPHVHAGSGSFQEQDRLCALEKKYHILTGGRNFPKANSSMKEVSRKNRRRRHKQTSFNVHVFNLDQLFEQDCLHISEPDLVYEDGPPHSSFSSSHIPSPELCPVRLQEVNLPTKPLKTGMMTC